MTNDPLDPFGIGSFMADFKRRNDAADRNAPPQGLAPNGVAGTEMQASEIVSTPVALSAPPTAASGTRRETSFDSKPFSNEPEPDLPIPPAPPAQPAQFAAYTNYAAGCGVNGGPQPLQPNGPNSYYSELTNSYFGVPVTMHVYLSNGAWYLDCVQDFTQGPYADGLVLTSHMTQQISGGGCLGRYAGPVYDQNGNNVYGSNETFAIVQPFDPQNPDQYFDY